jgi:hypothetical protein
MCCTSLLQSSAVNSSNTAGLMSDFASVLLRSFAGHGSALYRFSVVWQATMASPGLELTMFSNSRCSLLGLKSKSMPPHKLHLIRIDVLYLSTSFVSVKSSASTNSCLATRCFCFNLQHEL